MARLQHEQGGKVMLAIRFAKDESGQRRALVMKARDDGSLERVLVGDVWEAVNDTGCGVVSLPKGAWQPVLEPLEGVRS